MLDFLETVTSLANGTLIESWQMSALKYLLWPFDLCLTGLMGLVLLWRRQRCGTLWVVDLAPDDPGDFLDQAGRTLRFIREHDPRRADRVERHLRYLVNSSVGPTGGMYQHWFRRCILNYGHIYHGVVGWSELDGEAQRVVTMHLASTIVHEATHARLYDAGIRYKTKNREQIERICLRQQVYFMRRAGGELRDTDGQLVDWHEEYDFERYRDFYEEWWALSRWQFICQVLRVAWAECFHESSSSWRERHRAYWDYIKERRPWCVATLYTRGCYHEASNNLREALADFHRVIELNPAHLEGRLGCGRQLSSLERYEEAIEVFQAADAQGKEGAAGRICGALWALGRHEEALEWLDKWTDGPAPQRGRGLLLAELNRTDEAIEVLTDLVRDESIPPTSEEFSALTTLAPLLYESGRQAEYESTRSKIVAAIDRWRESGDAPPTVTVAHVVKVRTEMYEPGVVGGRAQVLVCPQDVDSPSLRTELENVGCQIQTTAETDDDDYESVYLRSLISRNDNFPWRGVPESLAGKRELWVVDAMLHRLLLPAGHLEDEFVVCTVLPIDAGYSICLGDGNVWDPKPAVALNAR